MNILGEEQKRLNEEGISEEEFIERKERFLEHYYYLREKDEQSFLGRLSLKARQRLHPIVLGVYRAKNRIGGLSFEVIGDKRSETTRPLIFAITHVGKFDIEVVSEAIEDHYYLLSGDFEHIQGIIDAPFLLLNGVIYFNEKVQSDRKAVTQKMIDLLQDGGNLMYFPEGTWNLSPNLPVLPCYWGIVDVAQRGNATIIPVAAEQYGKHFVINIGENFEMSEYGADKATAIDALRDALATLKWQIWESRPLQLRAELDDEEWNTYIEHRFGEWPYFNMDYINELIFKPKGIANCTDVFSCIQQVQPYIRNAFLFRK